MKYQYDSPASSLQCTVNVPRKAENLSNDSIIENGSMTKKNTGVWSRENLRFISPATTDIKIQWANNK